VVLIDLPHPSTAQLNRFYTIEFFRELKKILNDKAVVSFSTSSSENYQSPELKRLNSALFWTVQEVFANVIIIPGDRNFFIASDLELDYNVPKLLTDKRIETAYVNEYYMVGKLTEDRITQIEKSIIPDVKVNKDFEPIAYYYQLQLWLIQHRFNMTFFLILMLACVGIYLYFIRPVPFAIFTTGFAAAGLEVVILISFQILYGYVYHNIGIIIACFMLGLAIGSYTMNIMLKKMKKRDLFMLEIGIAVFAFVLPFLLIVMSRFHNTVLVFVSAQVFVPFLTLLLAILVGMEFPLAAKLHFKKVSETAASIYSADFIGAFVGALLVSALLIPILGLVKVCFLVCGLNLLSGIILWRS